MQENCIRLNFSRIILTRDTSSFDPFSQDRVNFLKNPLVTAILSPETSLSPFLYNVQSGTFRQA